MIPVPPERSSGAAPPGSATSSRGNASDGVTIESSTGNYVRGNHIGIDAAGRGAGQPRNGVYLATAPTTTPSGEAPPGRATSSAATPRTGSWSSTAPPATPSRATTSAPTRPEPSRWPTAATACTCVNGANTNTIGGSGAGEGNLVSGNQFSGVRIAAPTTATLRQPHRHRRGRHRRRWATTATGYTCRPAPTGTTSGAAAPGSATSSAVTWGTASSSRASAAVRSRATTSAPTPPAPPPWPTAIWASR